MNIKASKIYAGVAQSGNKLLPTNSVSKLILDPGAYKIDFDSNLGFYFEQINFTSDEVLDLPSAAYQQVTREMTKFLLPDTEEAFKKLGFIYKRSSLLHGKPGTGKTCIVNRIAEQMVNKGNIVLFSPNPNYMAFAYNVLSDLQPDQTTLVIFEEIDAMIERGFESQLLVLLDGQIQKNKIIYLATTNYIEKVPARLYRPGRFSSVIEVKFPEEEARFAYLAHKLGADHKDIIELTKVTEGLSIDEVKEVVQSVYLLDNTLESTLLRIRNLKNINPSYSEEDQEDLDDTAADAGVYTMALPGFTVDQNALTKAESRIFWKRG